MKTKLAFKILATVVLAALTPVLSANIFGWGYGRLILGKGGAPAEFIQGNQKGSNAKY